MLDWSLFPQQKGGGGGGGLILFKCEWFLYSKDIVDVYVK